MGAAASTRQSKRATSALPATQKTEQSNTSQIKKQEEWTKQREQAPPPAPVERRVSIFEEADLEAPGEDSFATKEGYSSNWNESWKMKAGAVKKTWIPSDREFYTKFQAVRVLGKGSFAVVKQVKEVANPSREWAVKVLDKSSAENDRESLLNELGILAKCQHRNVICLKEAYESPQFLYIVTELATGGQLSNLSKCTIYEEKNAQSLFQDMVSAVEYLHMQGIVHRDLKPENILLSDPSPDAIVKVLDLGLARLMPSTSTAMSTICGSYAYLAPEVLLCDNGMQKKYTAAVDIWGLGHVLYAMLFGSNPFYNRKEGLSERCKNNIIQGHFAVPSDSNVSDEAKALIQGMLEPDPTKRLTVDAIQTHPWFYKTFA